MAGPAERVRARGGHRSDAPRAAAPRLLRRAGEHMKKAQHHDDRAHRDAVDRDRHAGEHALQTGTRALLVAARRRLGKLDELRKVARSVWNEEAEAHRRDAPELTLDQRARMIT